MHATCDSDWGWFPSARPHNATEGRPLVMTDFAKRNHRYQWANPRHCDVAPPSWRSGVLQLGGFPRSAFFLGSCSASLSGSTVFLETTALLFSPTPPRLVCSLQGRLADRYGVPPLAADSWHRTQRSMTQGSMTQRSMTQRSMTQCASSARVCPHLAGAGERAGSHQPRHEDRDISICIYYID
jgi:hypothetical protein